MDGHFAETRRLAESIEGMISPFSMAVLDSLLGFQRTLGIGGDMTELGVYRGKSAAILARNAAAGETLHLYYIEDYFDRARLN